MPRTCKMQLRCEYSEVELAEKRDELSSVTIGAGEVEARKADAAKGFKDQLDALYSRGHVLAVQIKARGENREIDCAVELNNPTVGIKRIVRLDTGEFVQDEAMTAEERQIGLFEAEDIQKLYLQSDPRPEPGV